MQAGLLNSRIIIMQPALSAKNEYGEQIPEWKDVGKVWANVRYVSGREYARNGMDSGMATVSVQVRNSAQTRQIGVSWRLQQRDQILNIVAVLPDERRRETITFACTQIAGM